MNITSAPQTRPSAHRIMDTMLVFLPIKGMLHVSYVAIACGYIQPLGLKNDTDTLRADLKLTTLKLMVPDYAW